MSSKVKLPQYQSHKKVFALKIAKIEILPSGGAIIEPMENEYAEFAVTKEYIEKHKPEIDGYWVLYSDDYQSFSPREVFEEGYSLIEPNN